MRTGALLTRVAAWSIVPTGVVVGLWVLFEVHDQHGFGWAAAAFACVVLPCVALSQGLHRLSRRLAPVEAAPTLPPEGARFCARCGMETHTHDPTCTFCGGTRFLPHPPHPPHPPASSIQTG